MGKKNYLEGAQEWPNFPLVFHSRKSFNFHSQLRFNFKDSSLACDMLWIRLISWFGLTKEEPKACCNFPFCRPMTVRRQEVSSTGLLCHGKQRIQFNLTLQILQLSTSSEGLHLCPLIMEFYSSRTSICLGFVVHKHKTNRLDKIKAWHLTGLIFI